MQQNDTQQERMTKTPIPKLVLSLAVPTMISMLVTSLYNVADTYFVSRLGTSPAGAIGIVFSLMAMIQAIGFTVGMGAGSTISRLLGKKEEEQAQEVAISALITAIVLGLFLSVLGLLFLEKLMKVLGATETILPYAVEYARYILYAAPIMIATFVLNNLLRAEGKTKLAMIGIGIGSILNILLDPWLIFVWNWGITGAAAATAVSQGISFLVLFSYYFRKKTILRFSLRNLSKKASVYGRFLQDGMPSLFRQGLASVSSVALNHAAAAIGDDAVAAMAIVGKIFMLVYCVLIGFGQGYQPVAGYNYGAGKYGRVKSAFHYTLWAGNIGMSVVAVLLYGLTPWLLQRFVSEEGEVLKIGQEALRMQCLAMPLMPLGVVCNMTFQAVGKPVLGTFLASCRQGVFFLPFIWWLPRCLGVSGMELAQPLADAATFVVCLPAARCFLKKLKTQK